MLRLMIFLVGMLSTNRPGRMRSASLRPDNSFGRSEPSGGPRSPNDGDTWFLPLSRYRRSGRSVSQAAGAQPDRGYVRTGRRRLIPRKLEWAAVLVLAALVFRKVIAWAVLVALSATLHLVGIDVRLPHLKLAWPWQSISAGTTTDTDIGPWVLQKIEGISRPALGTENFNFTFTHKVSKSVGIWPCWYSGTFASVGHASATVNLNPGPDWWTPASGHYRLQVLSRPATGTPGRVSVTMALPLPQLPQSVHDVTVDNTLSHPITVQHSWTYPGLGCGALIQPQFAVSVLYSQAQNLTLLKSGTTRRSPAR